MKRLLLLLFLFGCGDPLSIIGPQIITQIEPLPEYVQWHAEMEECTGITGDFDHITWYTFPDRFECDAFGTCSGVWNDHGIYLQEANMRNPVLVKHEIIHELLHGNASHDSPAWPACGYNFDD